MMRLSLLIVSLIAAFVTDPVLGKPVPAQKPPLPPVATPVARMSVTEGRRDTNNSSAYVLAQQLLSMSSDNCTGIGGGCAVFGEALPSCGSSDDQCACDLSLAAQVCAQCDATTDAYSQYNTYLQACVTEGFANPSGTVSAAINAATGSSASVEGTSTLVEPSQSASAVQGSISSASASQVQSQSASGVLGIQAGILSDTLSASVTSTSTSAAIASASTSGGVVLLQNGDEESASASSATSMSTTSASLASASASSDGANSSMSSDSTTSASSASQTASDVMDLATASISANSSSAISSSSASDTTSAASSSTSANATSSVSVTSVPTGSVGAEAAVATATTTVNGDFGVRRATVDIFTALILVLSTMISVTVLL